MAKINLSDFCNGGGHCYTGHPVRTSVGVVATDGQIAICVPDDGGEYPESSKMVSVMASDLAHKLGELNYSWISVAEILEESPSLASADQGLRVLESQISLRHFLKIINLPGCRLGAPKKGRSGPLVFVFEGGFGSVMPFNAQRAKDADRHLAQASPTPIGDPKHWDALSRSQLRGEVVSACIKNQSTPRRRLFISRAQWMRSTGKLIG